MSSQSLESKVFSRDNRLFNGRAAAEIFLHDDEDKPVCFVGSIGVQPEPEKTYKDTFLSLYSAPFSLKYLFSSILVNVHFCENAISTNCAADASTTTVCQNPGFDMFNNSIDHLYTTLLEAVNMAKSEIVNKADDGLNMYVAIVQRYPGIKNLDFVKTSFGRFVTLNMPYEEGGLTRLTCLESELKERYQVVDADDAKAYPPGIYMRRSLRLDPDIRANMLVSNLGSFVSVSSEAFCSREKFEQAIRYVVESQAMKGKGLKVNYNDPNMFGVKWMIRMPVGGNYVLQEVFSPDIEQLRYPGGK